MKIFYFFIILFCLSGFAQAAEYVSGIAGETISNGQVVCMDAVGSTGKWFKVISSQCGPNLFENGISMGDYVLDDDMLILVSGIETLDVHATVTAPTEFYWRNDTGYLTTTYSSLSMGPIGETLSTNTVAMEPVTAILNAPRTLGVPGSWLTPAPLVATANNYNPSGYSKNIIGLNLEADADARGITGIDSTGSANGRRLFIHNTGSHIIWLWPMNASSTSSNQLWPGLPLNTSISLNPDEIIELEYSTDLAIRGVGNGRWIIKNNLFPNQNVASFEPNTFWSRDKSGFHKWEQMPNCTDTGGNHLNFTATTNAFSCGSSSGSSAHNLLSATHGDTTTASVVRGDGVFGIGATPKWTRVAHSSATGGYYKWNGTDMVASTLAASGTGSPTGCTDQVTTDFTLNADAAPTMTCTTITGNYFGSSIGARTVLVNDTASAAAPAFGTNIDVLSYQTAEIPSDMFVTTNWTTAANTNLQAITGLSWTFPANTALSIPVNCHLLYSQATAVVPISFGVQDVTVAPTSASFSGTIWTKPTANTAGWLQNLTTTTATAVVTETPINLATVLGAEIHGFIEHPSNASSSVFQIMVKTSNSSDLVTIYRGSYCTVGF